MIDTSFNQSMQLMMVELLMKLIQQQGLDVEENSSDFYQSFGSSDFADIVKTASEKYNVDEELINSVIKAESNFYPNAVSNCGAEGLMQLMPGTALSLGVNDSFDPEQNILGGTNYLRKMLTRYGGDVELALAAYNAGPGAVDKYEGIPPYAETQAYVKRVLNYYGVQKSLEAG